MKDQTVLRSRLVVQNLAKILVDRKPATLACRMALDVSTIEPGPQLDRLPLAGAALKLLFSRRTLWTSPHGDIVMPRTQPQPPFPPQTQKAPGLESEMDPLPKYEAPDYKAAGKLDGKVALITGGDSGIGRAVAVLFAREGADVSIVYLPEEQSDADEARTAVEREGRQALLIAGDVSDPTFCRKAVEQTVKALGRLDVLVNNAAYQRETNSIEELDEKQWEKTFRVNIGGYFSMAKPPASTARIKIFVEATFSSPGSVNRASANNSSSRTTSTTA